MNNRTIKVRYRYGSAEFEAEGDPIDVNAHTALFLHERRNRRTTSQQPSGVTSEVEMLQLPLPIGETPSLAGEGVSNESIIQGKPIPSNLRELYRKLTNVNHKVLILTVLYHERAVTEGLSYDEVMAAIDSLRVEGVAAPKRTVLMARMNDLIDDRLVYKPDLSKNKYAITNPGIDEINRTLRGD